MQFGTPQGRFGILFGQVDWQVFLREFWARRPLHIRDCRALTGTLPGLSEFPALLAGSLSADGWDQSHSEIQASHIDETSRVRHMMLPVGQWARAYNAGFSLCVNRIEHWHAGLQELVDDCKHSSRCAGEVGVSAYLTPKRSGGPMHFDSQHTFFLQVSGEKRWRISTAPAAVAPLQNTLASQLQHERGRKRLKSLGIAPRPPESCEMEELILREGEALYLPPGAWHEPRTSDSASLHYTLALHPVSFSSLFMPYLQKLLVEQTAWRTDLRYLDPESADRLITERLEETRALLKKVSAAELVAALAVRDEPENDSGHG